MKIFWLCLAFIALPFVAWGLIELLRAYLLPAKRVPARLKRKDTFTQETFGGKTLKKYRLVFEIDGEKKGTWTVTQEQYILARPGTQGTLVTRGRRFISFP